MALTVSRDVPHFVDQELREFKVAASANVFKGAFVSLKADGYLTPVVAGDKLAGIAYEEADNSSGADGDKKVRVFTEGTFQHTLSGAAQTNVGDAVYASADDTLTFTSTSNTYVGFCVGVPEAGKIDLRLDTLRTGP